MSGPPSSLRPSAPDCLAASRPVQLFTGRLTALVDLLRGRLSPPPRTALVVGCGTGIEAAALAAGLHARVTGIDIGGRFDAAAASIARLMVADAMHLPFPDRSFDFVYSYHALEHIADPARALAEMRRVLAPGGWYFVGTPNRTRIVAYIGSRATLAERVRWNLADWNTRLRGRFRNEYGAHAGFSAEELESMLATAFGNRPFSASEAYYQAQYPKHQALVGTLTTAGLSRFVFPCVYFLGRSGSR